MCYPHFASYMLVVYMLLKTRCPIKKSDRIWPTYLYIYTHMSFSIIFSSRKHHVSRKQTCFTSPQIVVAESYSIFAWPFNHSMTLGDQKVVASLSPKANSFNWRFQLLFVPVEVLVYNLQSIVHFYGAWSGSWNPQVSLFWKIFNTRKQQGEGRWVLNGYFFQLVHFS